jgi:hypothetical protein
MTHERLVFIIALFITLRLDSCQNATTNATETLDAANGNATITINGITSHFSIEGNVTYGRKPNISAHMILDHKPKTPTARRRYEHAKRFNEQLFVNFQIGRISEWPPVITGQVSRFIVYSSCVMSELKALQNNLCSCSSVQVTRYNIDPGRSLGQIVA